MSKQPQHHSAITRYEEAFFGDGGAIWGPSQLEPTGPDKVEPFTRLEIAMPTEKNQREEYIRGMCEIARYPDCGETFTATNREGTMLFLYVPTAGYESQVKPRIAQHRARALQKQGVASIGVGSTAPDNQEAILRQELCTIMFAPDMAQWHARQTVGEMHCTVDLGALAERGLHVDWQELGELAQGEMLKRYNIGTLRAEMSPWGELSLTLPPHDYTRLQAAMGHESQPTENNVTTMKGWRERHAEKEAAKGNPSLQI